MEIKVKYKNNFGLGDKIFSLIITLALIVSGIYSFIKKQLILGIIAIVFAILAIILFIKEKKINYFEKIIECDSFEVIEGKDKTNAELEKINSGEKNE